jgi:hypothetical protein
MKRDIEILLIKLTDGGRIMRWSEPASGLCLEKRVDATDSIARQKERWRQVFLAMLDRELGTAG